MNSFGSEIIAWISPITLEFLSPLTALGLFALCAIPILFLGMRSLAGLGPVRKWVAIGARLAVLLMFVLILGGARFQRTNKDLEVMVVRDISQSTGLVRDFPDKSLQLSVEDYLTKISDDRHKPAEDRIGVVSFNENSLIDAPPNQRLTLDTKAIRDPGSGTDTAGAIQLALAALRKDAMHRLLLLWDGNSTTGDLDAAITACVAAGVPIDVMPLRYDVQNEVVVERAISPTWKRENEPFTLDVILRSTNVTPVRGKLSVKHNHEPLDLDPATAGMQTSRLVTVAPGSQVEHVFVPALESSGPHDFQASFEPENVVTQQRPAGNGRAEHSNSVASNQGDTLLQNNSASTYTFVKGKGKVLYIDNVPDGRGELLRKALEQEGIELDPQRTTVDQFPNDIISLQKYDAVVLANVPRGIGGLSEEQQKMLATYVHEMGGGLVMIGGENAFGAGGWAGSKLEEILPVNMDIPAQRQMPKGALVLAMHSCEMPDGNFWGEQCAIKASETLSRRDEIGVISYGWKGVGGGGSQWDFPLQEKGDGSRLLAAIKAMQLGDMPDFDDMLQVALNGRNGQPGLLKSDARQKHIIVISDGDPGMPSDATIQTCIKNQISISTVTVYTHIPGTRSPQMDNMAKLTRGRAYGPIEANPNQLPQIFIKEATVVRRSLIFEDKNGIAVKSIPSSSDMAKGLEQGVPPVYGLVLTTKKPNPQVEMPLVAGKANDPLLASWQTGLGKAAVFTSDAHNWSVNFRGAGLYEKFWAQVVRSVARAPMTSDVEVRMKQDGDKAKIVVEALNKDSAFLNFLSVHATVVTSDPGKAPQQVNLVQTGPGTYEAEIDAKDAGSYCAVVNYSGTKESQAGMTLGSMVVNTSPELRDLRSNESALKQVADRTGGRLLPPFDVSAANLFSRDGLKPSVSPLPIWDILIPILLSLILIDVAIRRIAWDWNSTKRMVASGRDFVMSFTTTRKIETRGSIDALKKVRTEADTTTKPPMSSAEPRPDPRAKFEASPNAKTEGDITKVMGGATDKPLPSAPRKIEPKGASTDQGSSMSSLMAAKKRAQEQMKKKEEEQ